MIFAHDGWSLTLDANGGRITELVHNNVRILGTYQRIDGKSGSTHLCVPSFDKEGQEKYNLPFHGYARTLIWKSKQLSADTIQMRAITPYSQEYPTELELTQEFTLSDSFTHTVTVKHLSGKEAPLNIGIHYYWDTPHGWENTTLNSEQVGHDIKTNDSIDLKKENIILFPHITYKMRTDGFHSAVLWTSFKLNEDGEKKYSTDFCCIEPVVGWPNYFGSNESMLYAGETKTVSVVISLSSPHTPEPSSNLS
jgi:galactose mutarotase-like enzyme